MTPLYIGIDVGGTVVKSAVFDDRGAEVAVSARPLQAVRTQPGYTERDTKQLWEATAATVRDVVSRLPSGSDNIAAVCCTGHGNGIYLLDKDGDPVGNGIVSSDTRTYHMAVEAEGRTDLAQIRSMRGQRFHISEPLLLFRWFDECRPDLAARTRHALLCKDYIRYRLTDRIESELTDLSGSGLLDLSTGEYLAGLFEAFGVEPWRSRLPEIRRNSDLCGSITASAAQETGLRAGTPVVAGTMDLDAMVLASGVADASRFAICAGTWSINLLVLEQPCRDRLPIMQALHRDGQRIVACEGSPTSATNLAWFLDAVLDGSKLTFAAVNAMVDRLPAQDTDLVYLPDIHGGVGARRAGFVGLGHDSGKAHMLRAIYEGVVFAHLAHIDDLAICTGLRPTAARLCGGAAQSPVWAQMFADILEMDIEVAEGSELGALGCAICAAVATGRYSSFEQAMAAMTRIERTHQPDLSRSAIYRGKRAAFEHVRHALDPVWPRLGV